MAFLNDRCVCVPLTQKIVAACAPFSCGNKDLDEFFAADYLDYANQDYRRQGGFSRGDVESRSFLGQD